MRLHPTPQKTLIAPIGTGTAGLPNKFQPAREPLFRPSAGSLAAHRQAISLQAGVNLTNALGIVIGPETSLQDAIAQSSGTIGGPGGRIYLTEGTWDFKEGVTIDQDYVEIIALSPGSTIFRARSAAALPMITITGSWVRIQGVSFDDQVGTASVPLYVRGPYATIDNCVFREGKGVKVEPIGTGRCDGVTIRNCLFDLAAANASIEITGLNDLCQVLNNRFLATGYITISSPLTTNTVIVGNSLASPGAISYPFGYGTIEVGNTPSGGYLSGPFTLADNQVAQADVGSTVAWDVTKTYGVTLKYALYRGATPDIATGNIDMVMNSAECLVYADYQTTTVNPGVLFYGAVSGGMAYLQYTTTPTGSNATLRLSVVQERNY